MYKISMLVTLKPGVKNVAPIQPMDLFISFYKEYEIENMLMLTRRKECNVFRHTSLTRSKSGKDVAIFSCH